MRRETDTRYAKDEAMYKENMNRITNGYARTRPPRLEAGKKRPNYQFCLIDQKNTRVRFEVDALGLLDNLQTADGDVSLISETETDEVQHDGRFNQRCVASIQKRARNNRNNSSCPAAEFGHRLAARRKRISVIVIAIAIAKPRTSSPSVHLLQRSGCWHRVFISSFSFLRAPRRHFPSFPVTRPST